MFQIIKNFMHVSFQTFTIQGKIKRLDGVTSVTRNPSNRRVETIVDGMEAHFLPATKNFKQAFFHS